MNTEYRENIDLANDEIRKTLDYLMTTWVDFTTPHCIPQFTNLLDSQAENDKVYEDFISKHHDNMINSNGTYEVGPHKEFFLNQFAYRVYKGDIVTEKDKIEYFLYRIICTHFALTSKALVLSKDGLISEFANPSSNQTRLVLKYIYNNLYSDVKQYFQSSLDTLADMQAIRSTKDVREAVTLNGLIPEANKEITKVLSFIEEHKSELFREICLPTEDSDLTKYEKAILDNIHNQMYTLGIDIPAVELKPLSDDTERFVGSYFIYRVVYTKEIVSKKDITNYFLGDKEYVKEISEDGLIKSVTHNRGCISYLYDIIDNFCGNTISDLSSIIEVTRLADVLNHNIKSRKGLE